MMETWDRLSSLDMDFAFLLALPFVIGLFGLAREALGSRANQVAASHG